MKILVLTDIFPCDEEPTLGTFVYELSKAVSHKNQIIVIHPRLWNPFKISYNSNYTYKTTINGIEVYRPRLFVLPKGDRLFFRSFASFITILLLTIKLRRQFDFELIHAHMACPAGFAGILTGRILKIPVVITTHGSDIHSFPKNILLKNLVLFTIKRADKVVAVSQSLKDSILRMGVDEKYLSILRNGVKHEHFFPINKIKSRENLNLPPNKKIILFIGSLLPIKCVDVLLRAFIQIDEKVHTNIILLGKGTLESHLKLLSKQLNIDKDVFFVGSKMHDEISLWLSACDVFCLPSRNEGFPTVIVEALACGRPVVATRVGGIPEAVINDTLSILVEPNNIVELAAALNKALGKEWDYQAIAEYGKRFSWDTIAEEYSELYKNIVSKK